MRAGVCVALVAVTGCGSSSGGPGVETNRYPGGEVMPIGAPPVVAPAPIPPPACVVEPMTADAAGDVVPDFSPDAADSGSSDGGEADVVASDSPDAGADNAAGVGPCLSGKM